MYEEYEIQTTESDREITLMRLHDSLDDDNLDTEVYYDG